MRKIKEKKLYAEIEDKNLKKKLFLMKKKADAIWGNEEEES